MAVGRVGLGIAFVTDFILFCNSLRDYGHEHRAAELVLGSQSTWEEFPSCWGPRGQTWRRDWAAPGQAKFPSRGKPSGRASDPVFHRRKPGHAARGGCPGIGVGPGAEWVSEKQ